MINSIFIIDHYKRMRDKYKVIDKTLYQLLNWALKSATFWWQSDWGNHISQVPIDLLECPNRTPITWVTSVFFETSSNERSSCYNLKTKIFTLFYIRKSSRSMFCSTLENKTYDHEYSITWFSCSKWENKKSSRLNRITFSRNT